MNQSPENDSKNKIVDEIPRFDRDLFGSEEKFTRIGSGSIGGKAAGLAFIKDVLISQLDNGRYKNITVNVPTLTVIGTDVFDLFMQRNELYDDAFSDMPDDRIAHAFQRAEFPAEFCGDLRGLIEKVHTPLAVRSSSLLEDAIFRPFAGVYGTKMIPNNQADAQTRFKLLIEAIKFVYASTFFKEAKDYIKVTGQSPQDEKMAVIIQEVVGNRYGDRFYPNISGVARSYNYYPFGDAQPEQGVVSLALGLGKTIVDGGKSWTYCPAYPTVGPPYGSVSETLKQTQTEFWAVNMGRPPAHDPIRETEYLVEANLGDAEYDGTLDRVASTYVAQNDRIVIGTGSEGPRVLNFAPVLRLDDIPLNDLIDRILQICEERTGKKVEVEFAMEIDSEIRFGFLQVRPMVVAEGSVSVSETDLAADDLLLASNVVMGNGEINDIRDVVYVRPENFLAKNTRTIASEVENINRRLVAGVKPYLLMGFGRWGSSDPWLGIPVNWSQIAGAKVIVESTLEDMNVDPSQGSHFFHNITSFQICYFSVHHASKYRIAWDWLNAQPASEETDFVRHVELKAPLTIKVDGRNRQGVIRYGR
ncbi:MAG: PEP/pyruvate-binding domain-containing protein [Candidatus Zixiibacteriota bacterium]